LERYGGVLLLLVLVAVFAITNTEKFLTTENLIGILSNQAITAIIALGLLVPLATGVFDISIGGVMTLAVILCPWLFQVTGGGMPIPVAIAITLAVAVGVGLVNGGLVMGLKIDPFIATIGTSTVLLGVSQAFANGTTISHHIPAGFTDIARTTIGTIPITVFYALALGALLWYVLDLTPIGRRVHATGAARQAALLSGVPVGKIIVGGYIVSAIFASLAGVLYSSRLGSGPPEVGNGYLLPSYAVAFLGATMIRPGRFNVPGLFVAIGIIAVGINGLQLEGIAFWVVSVFQGGALLIAVIISQLRKRWA
jgi:ribose transport system permease protein